MKLSCQLKNKNAFQNKNKFKDDHGHGNKPLLLDAVSNNIKDERRSSNHF
jgi:hypothetical protein